ncbi:MAG: hypothetical protein MMC33_004316 [Icmadophila ericetorum]|nr:hypothetical protein [Icmadophila ericetorum]
MLFHHLRALHTIPRLQSSLSGRIGQRSEWTKTVRRTHKRCELQATKGWGCMIKYHGEKIYISLSSGRHDYGACMARRTMVTSALKKEERRENRSGKALEHEAIDSSTIASGTSGTSGTCASSRDEALKVLRDARNEKQMAASNEKFAKKWSAAHWIGRRK